MRSERFKLRHVNEFTGTLVIVVVAVLISTLVWTGHSQRWFKSRVTLRIALPEAGAAGIRQGSEVYFLGTLVGSVSDVVVEETGRMEAQASIRRDFFRFVRADSSAVVKRKFGVAGDSFFEITRGHGQPLPEKHASIVCNEQFQSALESAIEEIHGQALLILKKAGVGLDTWAKLGADLGESRRRLDQLTARMEHLAAGIEAGKGTVGRLFTDTALSDEAQALLITMNEAMQSLQCVVTNMNLTIKNIQLGSARLPEIVDAVADETKDLPGLVLQTKSSMTELERLVEALQRQWLIRKYVNHTNPPSWRPKPESTPGEKPPVKPFRSPRGASH